ncbi:MAG: DUF2802 domain-containing protein [Gammaproteobacteria bacterium]|nr:DUF2802 domain-containing protein [Gammaproteobacteria bacterium]
MGIESYSLAELLSIAGAAGFILFWCIYLYRRVDALMDRVYSLTRGQRKLSGRGTALLQSAKSSLMRIRELTLQVEQLRARIELLERRNPKNVAYERAIHMVKQGAKVEELVVNCGLTPGEAKLVGLMHNKQPRQSTAKRRANGG